MMTSFGQIREEAKAKGKKRIVVAPRHRQRWTSSLCPPPWRKAWFSRRDRLERGLIVLGERTGEEGRRDRDDRGARRRAGPRPGHRLLKKGGADILMRGALDPRRFLDAVLDKEKGLLKERVASLVSVFDPPGVGRVTMATDTYINSFPSIVEKVTITENVIRLARVLGFSSPKIAALSAIEQVNPAIPSTLDAAILSKMAERGQFGDVTLEGPLDIDCAVSQRAASRKGVHSAVTGKGDIYLMPNVEAGFLMAELSVFIGKDPHGLRPHGGEPPRRAEPALRAGGEPADGNRACRPFMREVVVMEKTRHILAINVGSTSTKVAFYRDSERLVQESLTYSAADLAGFKDLRDQLPLREAGLRAFIEKNKIDMGQVDLVISRGGLGRPAPAGAYAVDEAMCEDLMEGRYGKHPSALGPSMAIGLARLYRNGRGCDRPAEHRRVPGPGTRVGPARDRAQERLPRPQPEGRRAPGGRAD